MTIKWQAISMRSMRDIVTTIYDNMSPSEQQAFDAACIKSGLRPETLIRRQFNAVVESSPSVDPENLEGVSHEASVKGYEGLLSILRTCSHWEYWVLRAAISRANQMVERNAQ